VAQSYELEAQKRELFGRKVGRLRREGIVPISVYGARTEHLDLQVPYRALQVTLAKAGGTHLINLSVDGKVHTVLARQVQRDPVRREILHVDFFEVDQNTRVTTEVPVHLIGESSIVNQRLGNLVTALTTLSIESLATKLIDSVEVDISALKQVGDTITVSDLKLGSDYKIENGPEEVIVRIAAVGTETEETTDESTSAEPEVIKKGKADEEGDEE
jgi:large subunit ribosomal protein L25